MSKPNLVEMLRNENRLAELEELIPAMFKDWANTPKEDIAGVAIKRSRLEQYQQEYRERLDYKDTWRSRQRYGVRR